MKYRVWLVCLCLVILVFSAWGKRRHHTNSAPSQFDYYLLSMSWAPTYCAEHPTDQTSECTIGGHTAFVLHGLWPQANDGAPPLSCAPARPVAASIVTHMLQFFPSRGLVQHEWEKHGTCTGLSSDDYFRQVEQAYTGVHVPPRYFHLDSEQQIAVSEIEHDFATLNRADDKSFRISCHAGGLVAVEACLDKDLHYQACTASVRECPGRQVTLLPPK